MGRNDDDVDLGLESAQYMMEDYVEKKDFGGENIQ